MKTLLVGVVTKKKYFSDHILVKRFKINHKFFSNQNNDRKYVTVKIL